MHSFVSLVVVVFSVAQFGTADPEGRIPAKIHNAQPWVNRGPHDGVDLPEHRAKRQECGDQWSNCAVDVVYQDQPIAANFPGGSGCTSVAGTPSYLVNMACQCTKTCPAFCGAAICNGGSGSDGGNSGSGGSGDDGGSGSGSSDNGGTGSGNSGNSGTTTTTGLDTSLPDVQNNIVALHNAKRRLIPSPTMLELSWDSGIAALAQAWASQCIQGHPNKTTQPQYWNTTRFPSTGQNAAWGYSSWSDAIDGWYNEIGNFKFGVGSTTKDAIGHYTQLVWNTTYAVGCGYTKCPNWNAFICQYGPPGNMPPQYPGAPYLPGPACTGTNTCNNGLRTNPCPYTNSCGSWCDTQDASVCSWVPADCCKATCNCKAQGLLY